MRVEAVQKLKNMAQDANFTGFCFLPGRNLQYLTGVKFHLLERPFMIFMYQLRVIQWRFCPRWKLSNLSKLGLRGKSSPGKMLRGMTTHLELHLRYCKLSETFRCRRPDDAFS